MSILRASVTLRLSEGQRVLAHFAERSNEKELNAEITLLDTFSSIQPPQPLKIVLHHKTYAVSLAHSTIHIFA